MNLIDESKLDWKYFAEEDANRKQLRQESQNINWKILQIAKLRAALQAQIDGMNLEMQQLQNQRLETDGQIEIINMELYQYQVYIEIKLDEQQRTKANDLGTEEGRS